VPVHERVEGDEHKDVHARVLVTKGSTTMDKPTKPKPAFGTTRSNVPGVLARANIMYAAILAALATFASPPVTMVAFLLLLQAAAAAQSAAAGRGKGLASVRDTKVDALWTAMNALKTYVHGLASTLDVANAMALIESAGLEVGKLTKPAKLLLAATYVPATGIVHLVVNATMLLGKRPTKKTTFTWCWSSDGGKTWSPGVTTGYADLDVPGLPPGTYELRVFATVGRIPGDPTQPVGLTIH
jgi:hypothetical protein